jgi:hypothetical protein
MEALDRKALRLMIIEALAEMKRCPGCGGMYEMGSGHDCNESEDDPAREDELDEFSGAGAVAGYTLPLGMRPPGPRRGSILSTAHRSFGGLPKQRKKR